MHRRRLSPINRPRIELKRLSKLNEIRQRLNDQLSRWSVDKGIRLWSSITTRFRANRRWINGTRIRIKPLFWLIVGESEWRNLNLWAFVLAFVFILWKKRFVNPLVTFHSSPPLFYWFSFRTTTFNILDNIIIIIISRLCAWYYYNIIQEGNYQEEASFSYETFLFSFERIKIWPQFDDEIKKISRISQVPFSLKNFIFTSIF